MDRTPGALTFVFGLLSGVLLAFLAEEFWPSDQEPDLSQYREIRDFARESFVREVDDAELVKLALDGMLRGLDEYSRYFDTEQSKDLQRETLGRFRGIGAIFQRPIEAGRVLYPVAGSPAERAGLRVGDQFLTIGGQSLENLTEAEFRALLSGPQGETLSVTVRGMDGTDRALVIRPDSIVDATVRHAHMILPERGLGYLAITSFSSETAVEFDRSFEFLRGRGASSLLLDLRGNLGGVLDSAVAIARRFVPEGVIVSTEGRGEPIVYRAEASSAWYQGTPLVVLVDGDTASASEALAGALQDHRTAAIVGSPTYGKGMVQIIRSFSRWETKAKVTSSYYYSPTGRHFERSVDPSRDHGILPDVLVEATDSERAALLRFLRNYGPHPEVIPALEAWEKAEGLDLIEKLPRDPQLEAALGLFLGERPGPQPLDSQ